MNAGIWLRRASLGLAVAVLALGAMTYRVVRDGEAALAESDAAFNRGDLPNAVLYARRAAIAYAPGAPHTGAALARLRAVAVGSEGAGDAATARLAWGAIRASALETRHVATPYAAELEEANGALARLGSGVAGDRLAAEREAKKLLARVPGPAPLGSLLLVVGFVGAAAGLWIVAVRGLTREGKVLSRGMLLGLGVFALGAACWAWAVYRA